MSSYTPNLNLYKPDGTDDYGNFLAEFNDNMDKIDDAGGGGGGGGGDTTNIYGCFIDTNSSTTIAINDGSVAHSTYTYTATEDCFVDILIQGNSAATVFVKIDGKTIYQHIQTPVFLTDIVPLRKGQVISFENLTAYSYLTIYGVNQGTDSLIHYTLTEQVIGTWLGKPLYEIAIPFSGINMSANAWYSYNISSYLTNPEIVFPQKDMSYYIVSNVERLFSEISYESPNLLLKTPVARTNISGHVVVRYTKTTD